MATRGRKPLPTALKELEGDRGKGRRPLNKDEPTPPHDNVKCPAWLMPEAKKEWKRLAPSLIAMGVLTEHDMEAFAGYCQAYARWREAEEFLSQHGTIFKTPSGYKTEGRFFCPVFPEGNQRKTKEASPCLDLMRFGQARRSARH